MSLVSLWLMIVVSFLYLYLGVAVPWLILFAVSQASAFLLTRRFMLSFVLCS